MDLIRVLRMATFNLEIEGRDCGRLKSREEVIRVKRDRECGREVKCLLCVPLCGFFSMCLCV